MLKITIDSNVLQRAIEDSLHVNVYGFSWNKFGGNPDIDFDFELQKDVEVEVNNVFSKFEFDAVKNMLDVAIAERDEVMENALKLSKEIERLEAENKALKQRLSLTWYNRVFKRK